MRKGERADFVPGGEILLYWKETVLRAEEDAQKGRCIFVAEDAFLFD